MLVGNLQRQDRGFQHLPGQEPEHAERKNRIPFDCRQGTSQQDQDADRGRQSGAGLQPAVRHGDVVVINGQIRGMGRDQPFQIEPQHTAFGHDPFGQAEIAAHISAQEPVRMADQISGREHRRQPNNDAEKDRQPLVRMPGSIPEAEYRQLDRQHVKRQQSPDLLAEDGQTSAPEQPYEDQVKPLLALQQAHSSPQVAEQPEKDEQACQAGHALDDIKHAGQIERMQQPCAADCQRRPEDEALRQSWTSQALMILEQQKGEREDGQSIGQMDDEVHQLEREGRRSEQVGVEGQTEHADRTLQDAGVRREGGGEHGAGIQRLDPQLFVLDDVGKIVEQIRAGQARPISNAREGE